MIKLPEMNEFEGTWEIHRDIEDRMSNQNGTLDGTATLSPGGFEGGMIYRETGGLNLGEDSDTMEATRIYLWNAHPSGIAVFFQDGKPFHVIEMDRSMPDAQHHCAPDMYHVVYDFNKWPNWNVQWRVRGPRKDYRMVTNYKR